MWYFKYNLGITGEEKKETKEQYERLPVDLIFQVKQREGMGGGDTNHLIRGVRKQTQGDKAKSQETGSSASVHLKGVTSFTFERDNQIKGCQKDVTFENKLTKQMWMSHRCWRASRYTF